MATEELQYPGAPNVLRRAVKEFFGYGVLAWVGAFVYTLLALVVALVVFPGLVGYLLMATTAFAIHLAGVWTGDTEVETLELEYGDATRFQRTFVWVLLYLAVAVPVSALVLWSAAWAAYVGFGLGSPAGAVVVAVGYPLVDQYLAERVGLSVLRVSGVATLKLLGVIVRLYNISNHFMEAAERQTAALY